MHSHNCSTSWHLNKLGCATKNICCEVTNTLSHNLFLQMSILKCMALHLQRWTLKQRASACGVSHSKQSDKASSGDQDRFFLAPSCSAARAEAVAPPKPDEDDEAALAAPPPLKSPLMGQSLMSKPLSASQVDHKCFKHCSADP